MDEQTSVEGHLQDIEELNTRLVTTGQQLFDASGGDLFPADVLAMAVLNRSLSLQKGFVLLMRNGGYLCAAGLLRMQLDNILRLNGVITCADPHEVAVELLGGEALNRIRDGSGKKMTDARLREIAKPGIPWVDDVYHLSSGYIHLSDQHARHFLHRSARNSAGTRDIAIGDDDEYLDDGYRKDLSRAFAVITRGVSTVVSAWIDRRSNHGTVDELKKRFVRAA